MKQEKLNDEIAPFLQDLKGKSDGFKVPEGYLEDMEEAVFARLKSSGDLGRPTMNLVKRPRLFPWTVRPRTAMALAAALALILTAVWFIRQPQAVQPAQFVSTELTEDDLEFYVLENVQEFELEQLAALTAEKTSEPIEKVAPGTPKKNRSTSDEIHPDDLDKILDEMTDEELEQIL